MKKILLSLFVVGSFAGYAIYKNHGQEEHRVIPPAGISLLDTQAATTTVPAPAPAAGSPPAPQPSPTPAPAGQYKDGQYTGPVTDAFYGNYQVRAVVSGGKLTNVVFLQYPNDRSTSVQINQEAMPYLKAEAIAAQSANVDIISGATQSSQAFRQSLAAALLQARN